MAWKNQNMWGILTTTPVAQLLIESPTQREERIKAIDALLKVDLTDPDAFEWFFNEAVRANLPFWKRVSPGFETDDPMNPRRPPEDFVDNREYVAYYYLKQKAAEQRVMLGLQNASDDVLVGMLSNNLDECRAYLAGKKDLGMLSTAAQGWSPTPPLPTVSPPPLPGIDILPKEAVENLRSWAGNLLYLKFIKKNAPKFGAYDRPNLSALIIQLPFDKQGSLFKIPQKTLDSLLKAKTPEDVKLCLVGLNLDSVSGASDEFEKACAALAVENTALASLQQIQNVGVAKVLWNLNIKMTLDPAVITKINNVIKGMTDEDLNDGRQYALNLVDKIVEACQLKRDDAEKIYKAFGLGLRENFLEGDLSAPKTHIQQQHQFNKHLLKAANDPGDSRNKDLINMLLRIEKTNPLSDADITILDKHFNSSSNFQQFIDSFPTTHPSVKDIKDKLVNELTSTSFNEMKQAFRARLFEAKLEKASGFGPAFHPALVSAFKALARDKQDDLLRNPQKISHLLHAKNTHAVEFYLGRGNASVQTVVKENIKFKQFQMIWNSPIAQALGKIEPLINLDEAKVKAINKLISEIKLDDSGDLAGNKYQDLVKNIAEACNVTPNESFYKEFGLRLDGERFIKMDIPILIVGQHKQNKNLLEAVGEGEFRTCRVLLDVLLRLDKTESYDKGVITELNDHLKNSTTLKEFLGKIRGAAPYPEIKAGLTKELTSNSFDLMKVGAIAADFYSTVPRHFNEGEAAVRAKIDVIHKNRKAIAPVTEKLAFIDNIDTTHLCSPAFQAKVRAQPDVMKKLYKGLSDDCDLIVDQLMREKAILETYSKMLETPSVHRDDRSTRHITIQNGLRGEIKAIDESLKQYKIKQDKFTDVLTAIDKAAAGEVNYYYNPTGFTIRVGGETIKSRQDASSLTTVSVGRGPETVEDSFSRGARATAEKPAEYFFEREGHPERGATTTGMFEERGPQSASPATLSGDTTSKNKGSVFTIVKSITCSQPPRTLTPGTPPAQVSLDDAVDMHMALAVQIISRCNGTPPSKENPIRMYGTNKEELRHVWTALMVLGEKDPKMRFGRDAISVETPIFNPNEESIKKWGRSEQWSPRSLYTAYSSRVQAIGHAKLSSAAQTVAPVKVEDTYTKAVKAGQALAPASTDSARGVVKQMKANQDAKGPALSVDPDPTPPPTPRGP